MSFFKRFFSGLVILLFIFSVIGFSQKLEVHADGEMPYVIVSSYEVSGGKIIPGEEFDVSITVKNADSLYVANNVIVSMEAMTGIYSIYPSVPQVFVGNIGPQEERTVVFSYRMDSQFRMDTASFYAYIISGSNENSVVLSAPVELDDSAFSILSKNIPYEVPAGNKISASFYFRVRGEASLSNVLTRVSVDGEEIDSSSTGNVVQGASKTQNMVFSIAEVGKHNLLIEIEGIDQNGILQVTEVYNGIIDITEPEGADSVEVDNTVVNMRSKMDYLIMGGSLGLIILLVAGIVLLLRKINRV